MQLESRSRFHAEEHQRQPYSIVGSRYKVIIVLSSYFSSGAPQPTVHTSIIAAKKVSLIFFFELQYFGPDLRLVRTKTANQSGQYKMQTTDCRPDTKYRLGTKCRLQTGCKMQTENF